MAQLLIQYETKRLEEADGRKERVGGSCSGECTVFQDR